jgi:hypothetical protein
VESFAELDPMVMESIVQEMNMEDKWYNAKTFDATNKDDAVKNKNRPKLTVEEVLSMIEDMTMTH